MENLLLKQQQDRLSIEEQHTKEYEEFQQNWEQRLQAKDQENQAILQQLDERHLKDLEENRQVLEQRIPLNFKASSELLNLKKIQDGLARQKEYSEAHKIQQKIVELDRSEQEKYNQVRIKKIMAAESLLIQRQ